jgi:hypothetical protein
MKTPQSWSNALLVVISIAFLSPAILAQSRSQWPSNLPQRSSVVEIMDWLDKNIWPKARIGVRTSSLPRIDSDSFVLQQDEEPAHSLFYAQGFKLIKVDGCNVTLRNDDTRLIAHSRFIIDNTPQQRYRAELYVPLDRLSVTKGRAPYRHTKDPQKSVLLGAWRTEFKSNQSREEGILTLFLAGHTEKTVIWDAETLTFTFDTKEESEQFDAAFRQAIRLCRKK